MNYLQKICVVLAVLNLIDFAKAQTPKQNLSNNENICKAQPNGAILPNPYDCKKFYICAQQQSYEYNCDPTYHYDAKTHNCVRGPFCSSEFNKTATCVEGNIRQVPDNCHVFEACIKGEYQKLNCPPNFYFNAQTEICVPFKYDAEFKCNCLMPEYTVLENKNNCETYFVCHKKSAVLENCPLGQYYSADLNTCLTDLEGVCLMKPTVTSGHATQVQSEIQAICSDLGLKDIHFETFPKGCNAFYICVNGQLFTQRCPKGFYYHRDKKYCALDTAKKCHNTED